MKAVINARFDMPNHLVDQLIAFLNVNSEFMGLFLAAQEAL